MESDELKLTEGAVVWRQVDGETVVLDLCQSAYVGVNSAGSLLWSELIVGTTKDDLVALLSRTYDVPADRAKRDVEAFVSQCRERGYLR